MKPPTGNSDQYEWATYYRACGLSVIPVKADTSKAPAFDGWREFSDRYPTDRELARWFQYPRDRYAIGLPGGPAGKVVFLDFETTDAYERWLTLIPSQLSALVHLSPQVATPGNPGRHVYARCLGDPPRGSVYARRPDGKTLIEVRGRGHQVLAPGSPAKAHQTGRRYELLRWGWLDFGPVTPSVACWTAADLNAATDVMRALEQRPRKVVGVPRNATTAPTGDRPGDHFNRRAEWGAILEPYGWRAFRSCGNVVFWTRPGKSTGVSATTGHCKSEAAGDLLYVFSSSAAPFEPEVAYSRFAAYALLAHRGDFNAAGRALWAAGYGGPRVTIRLGGKVVSSGR